MEDLLHSVLSGIPLPALVIGTDERVQAMNAPAEALLGGGAKGRHHALSLRQPDMQSALAAALTEGRPVTARHVIAGSGGAGPGQDVIHRVTITPLAKGQGVICVFEDQTAAEQMGQMRREFVANVSHELRSPLTALLGFIETLRGAARDDPAARDRFLSIMEREAGRMNRLIQDLLNLSRVEATERMRPTQPVDIGDILRGTVAALRPQIEAAQVAVEIEDRCSRPGLPGDADQLVQVFQNLIENAIKYGSSGGIVTIRISDDVLPHGPAVRVDVIDRGDGIDPLHIPRLTERFYRVDGHRSREKGGTGLGLAIVKHIVQRHRGRLAITSTPGLGSTFSVLLPSQ